MGLSRQELRPVRVLLVNSILSPLVGRIVVPVLNVITVQAEDLARSSALGLLDIVHVHSAEYEEATEEEHEPAVTLIVEAVRLVPLGELPNILMRELRLFARLLAGSLELGVHVLLRNVDVSRVGAGVRVRVVEAVHSSRRGINGTSTEHGGPSTKRLR